MMPEGALQPAKHSIFVVIAAYNEAGAIGSVLSPLVQKYRCVVVDDGSTDATATEASRAGAIALRHYINRGQGAALQTGITYALRQGAEYLVTFDADGQHDATDIERLLEPLLAQRADVTLGSRFRGSVRGASPFRLLVLKAAVLFTRAVSGLKVTDTHNGLRGFTRRAAAELRIRQDRMAHASEILDEIHRLALPYEEVPVSIQYTDYSRAKGQRSTAAFRVLTDYLIGRWSK